MHRLTKVLTILSIPLMSGLALPAQSETEARSAWTPLRVGVAKGVLPNDAHPAHTLGTGEFNIFRVKYFEHRRAG